MRRHALGIIGLVLIVTGLFILFRYGWDSGQTSFVGSVCMRIGIILGLLWLALPQLTDLFTRWPLWVMGSFAMGIMVLAVRPKLFVVVGPILASIAVLQFVGLLFKPPSTANRSNKPRKGNDKQPTTDDKPPLPKLTLL